MDKIISVIIPAFNVDKFISETIKSVINQTYSSWELIIVNDGSTDNTANVITPFLKDRRIKYLYQNNQGVSSARNNGFKISKGDYIAFLDADDVWLPENLKKKSQCLKENISLGLVHADMEIIDEYSHNTGKRLHGKEGYILDDLLLWNGCIIPSPSSILLKRETIENVGEFDNSLSTAADQDLFIRVAAKYKIGRIKEVLGFYRIHGNNMHQSIALMEKDHLHVYQKAKKNKLFKSFWFKQKCFSNLYIILAGSWWKDGENKIKGGIYILKSIIIYPPNILKLLKKFL